MRKAPDAQTSISTNGTKLLGSLRQASIELKTLIERWDGNSKSILEDDRELSKFQSSFRVAARNFKSLAKSIRTQSLTESDLGAINEYMWVVDRIDVFLADLEIKSKERLNARRGPKVEGEHDTRKFWALAVTLASSVFFIPNVAGGGLAYFIFFLLVEWIVFKFRFTKCPECGLHVMERKLIAVSTQVQVVDSYRRHHGSTTSRTTHRDVRGSITGYSTTETDTGETWLEPTSDIRTTQSYRCNFCSKVWSRTSTKTVERISKRSKTSKT